MENPDGDQISHNKHGQNRSRGFAGRIDLRHEQHRQHPGPAKAPLRKTNTQGRRRRQSELNGSELKHRGADLSDQYGHRNSEKKSIATLFRGTRQRLIKIEILGVPPFQRPMPAT